MKYRNEVVWLVVLIVIMVFLGVVVLLDVESEYKVIPLAVGGLMAMLVGINYADFFPNLTRLLKQKIWKRMSSEYELEGQRCFVSCNYPYQVAEFMISDEEGLDRYLRLIVSHTDDYYAPDLRFLIPMDENGRLMTEEKVCVIGTVVLGGSEIFIDVMEDSIVIRQ
jgi:hypothetical protein